MKNKISKFVIFLSTLICTAPILADASPWLSIPQTVEVSISHVIQESTKFYRGTERVNLPFGHFDQTTNWVSVKYGWSDKIAFDFRGGSSDLDAGALGESSEMNDVSFGVTRSLLDEIEHGTASVSLRVGAIVAGGYDVGQPNSIGDGADAIETTLSISKVLTPRVAVAGGIALKFSSDDVPTETLLNVGLHIQVNARIGFYGQYQLKTSNGNLDIGGEGFTPAGFPETTEEYDRLRFGTGISITPELRFDLSIYDTRDGRNTADFDAVNLTVGYTFDLFDR